jgi:Ca-activated chloride channel family protein
MLRAALFSTVLATKAAACDLALVLAVDVSGSVDRDEYRIQMDGLAAALRDGIVAEALVDQQAMITLLQWTGSSRQRQTIPWRQMTSFAAVASLAAEVSNDPRIWRNYSTAIGEALLVSLDLLAEVPQCTRHVVDVSGDGRSNEGVPPEALRAEMTAAGITINALAIETDEDDLTAYFFENLIRGARAFVETANGFEDYPAAILRKLQRETTRIAAQADHEAAPARP